jgi:hypothetical protein
VLSSLVFEALSPGNIVLVVSVHPQAAVDDPRSFLRLRLRLRLVHTWLTLVLSVSVSDCDPTSTRLGNNSGRYVRLPLEKPGEARRSDAISALGSARLTYYSLLEYCHPTYLSLFRSVLNCDIIRVTTN